MPEFTLNEAAQILWQHYRENASEIIFLREADGALYRITPEKINAALVEARLAVRTAHNAHMDMLRRKRLPNDGSLNSRPNESASDYFLRAMNDLGLKPSELVSRARAKIAPKPHEKPPFSPKRPR